MLYPKHSVLFLHQQEHNERRFDDSKVLVAGENRSLSLEPGDGLLYKGCERPHWREAMPGSKKKSKKLFGKAQQQELYYHQIFFHYVLADGERAHCAWDRAR